MDQSISCRPDKRAIIGKKDPPRSRINENLAEYDYDLRKIPHVIQYNKRDLDDIVSVDQMRRDLNTLGTKDFEAVATKGLGVLESMNTVVEQVIINLKRELEQRRPMKEA